MENEPDVGQQTAVEPDNQEQSFYSEHGQSAQNQSVGATAQLPSGPEASWTASEYVHHQKAAGWYIMLGLGTLGLAALIYLVTRDWITFGTIVVVAGSFGFFASRQPRTLNYRIDSSGIAIGEKLYPYNHLRTFSIQQEGAIKNILLIPVKRFMPAISLYYPPEQENEIFETLSSYLPHEERRADPIDRLMHHVRF